MRSLLYYAGPGVAARPAVQRRPTAVREQARAARLLTSRRCAPAMPLLLAPPPRSSDSHNRNSSRVAAQSLGSSGGGSARDKPSQSDAAAFFLQAASGQQPQQARNQQQRLQAALAALAAQFGNLTNKNQWQQQQPGDAAAEDEQQPTSEAAQFAEPLADALLNAYQAQSLGAAANQRNRELLNAACDLADYCAACGDDESVAHHLAVNGRSDDGLLPALASILQADCDCSSSSSNSSSSNSNGSSVMELKLQALRIIAFLSSDDSPATADALISAAGLVPALVTNLLPAPLSAGATDTTGSAGGGHVERVQRRLSYYAAEALGSLTDGRKVDDGARAEISAAALPALIALLSRATANAGASIGMGSAVSAAPARPEAIPAARAVAGLARAASLRERIAAEGALPPLITLLGSDDFEEAAAAAEALARLAAATPVVALQLSAAGLLPVLAGLMGRLQMAWRAAQGMFAAAGAAGGGGDETTPFAASSSTTASAPGDDYALEDCSFWAAALLEELVTEPQLHSGVVGAGFVPTIIEALLMGTSSHVPRQAAKVLTKMAAAGGGLRAAVAAQLPLLVGRLEAALDAAGGVAGGGAAAKAQIDEYGSNSAVMTAEEAAAAALYWIISECPNLRSEIVSAGAAPPFVRLLSGDDLELAAFAAVALCDLSKEQAAARDAVVAAGALPPLVRLLRRPDGTAEVIDGALDCLYVLISGEEGQQGGGGWLGASSSSDDDGAEARRRAAHAAGARGALLELLEGARLQDDVKKAGVSMMLITLGLPSNRRLWIRTPPLARNSNTCTKRMP